MKRTPSTLLALSAAAALLAVATPAEAHSIAGGGLTAGLLHPLMGLDHLCMLLSVATAASCLSSRLLLWALAGAVAGAGLGGSGLSLPGGELLAALAVSALALVALLSAGARRAGLAARFLPAAMTAVGVAIHAMLHGLEAPRDGSTLLWWLGALVGSAAICTVGTLALRSMPCSWRRAAAVGLIGIGALLAFGPLGLLAGSAGA